MRVGLDNFSSNKVQLELIVFLCGILLLTSSFATGITGFATSSTQTTQANATINKYVAIALTTNLSSGITFGTVEPNSNNNNATGNWEGPSGGSNISVMNVTFASDSNTIVDLCIKDGTVLMTSDGSYNIANTAFTWNASTSAQLNHAGGWPANTSNTPWGVATSPGAAMSTSYLYADAANDTDLTAATNATFSFRFWLDIPLGQQAGTYNNTVFFQGTENTTACS